MRQVNSDHAYYFMIIIIYFVCVHPYFQVPVIFYANVLTCKRKQQGILTLEIARNLLAN